MMLEQCGSVQANDAGRPADMEQARKEALAREDVEGLPFMGKPGGRLPRVPGTRE